MSPLSPSIVRIKHTKLYFYLLRFVLTTDSARGIMRKKTFLHFDRACCFGFMPILYFFFVQGVVAQTLLMPGDVAILSMSTHYRQCGLNGSDDQISLVCFRDIAPGTAIDFTDNGWERLVKGRWGNSEGFVTAVRTGPTIPAGSILTFIFNPSSGQPYQATVPDSNWSFTQRTPNGLSLGMGGEQLFLLSGGSWSSNGTSPAFQHDATYTGGRILLGINTASTWTSFADRAEASGLPPGLAPCNRVDTPSPTDFLAYTGLLTPATPQEWVSRIQNTANWKSFSRCGDMPVLPKAVSVLDTGIGLQCSVCNSCAPYTETLRFSLPSSGGPFRAVLSNGRDTLSFDQLRHGDTRMYEVNTSSDLRLLYLTDAQGCTFFSNLGNPVALRITPVQAPAPIPPIKVCGVAGNAALFNLSARDSLLTQGLAGFRVNWYRDSILKNPISQPMQFSSLPTSVYALVSNGICSIGPIRVELEIVGYPEAALPLGGRLCAGEPCLPMPFVFKGTAPFQLSYTISRPGQPDSSGTRTFPTEQGYWTICPDSLGVSSGDILFRYKTITDGNNCQTDVDKQISVVRRGMNGIRYVRPVLCPGQNFVFQGNTYDATKLSDTLVQANATSTGCDSLIIIQLTYTDSLYASLSGSYQVCTGEALRLTWVLRGGTQFNIIYQEGEPQQGVANRELKGVRNGDLWELFPKQSVPIYILNVQSVESGCSYRPGIRIPVQVNDLSVSARPVARFGGTSVSCAGAADGAATAAITGGSPPYRISWSNGDSLLQANQLSAGFYHVTVTDGGRCRASASVQIKEPAPIRPVIEANPARCTGQLGRAIIQRVTGGVPPFRFSIRGNPYQSIAEYPFLLPDIAGGSYLFSVIDANLCISTVPFIMPEPDAIRVDLGQDRSIKAGDTVVLRASLNFQPALIRWSPSAETQGNTGLVLNVRPATTTTYQIEAQDSSGCKAIDEVLVRVSRTLHVYAPSAFSPNGDGNNDVFRLYPGPEVSAIRTMRIYNRWGVQVFEGAGDGSQAIPAWDGNIGSQPASTGAYLFVAELLFLDGHTDQIRGEFILLR